MKSVPLLLISFVGVALLTNGEQQKMKSIFSCDDALPFLAQQLAVFAKNVNQKWDKVQPSLNLAFKDYRKSGERLCYHINDEYAVQEIWFLATAPIEPRFRTISIDATLKFLENIFPNIFPLEDPPLTGRGGSNRPSLATVNQKPSTPRGPQNGAMSARREPAAVSGFNERVCSWYRTPFLEELKRGRDPLDMKDALVLHLQKAKTCLESAGSRLPQAVNPMDEKNWKTLMDQLKPQNVKQNAEIAQDFLAKHMPERYMAIKSFQPDNVDILKVREEGDAWMESYRNPCGVEAQQNSFPEKNTQGHQGKDGEVYLARVRYLEAVILCAGGSLDVLRGFDKTLEALSRRKIHTVSCELESFHFVSEALGDLIHTAHPQTLNGAKYQISADPHDWWEPNEVPIEKLAIDCLYKVFRENGIRVNSESTSCTHNKDFLLRHPTTHVDRKTAEEIARKLIVFARLHTLSGYNDWKAFFSRVTVGKKGKSDTGWPDLGRDYDMVKPTQSRIYKYKEFFTEQIQTTILLKSDVEQLEVSFAEHSAASKYIPFAAWTERLSDFATQVLAALPKGTIDAARLLLGIIDETERPRYVAEQFEEVPNAVFAFVKEKKSKAPPKDCEVTGTYDKDYKKFEKKFRTRFDNYLLPLYLFLVKWYSCGKGDRQEYVNLLLTPLLTNDVKDDPYLGPIIIKDPKPEFPQPAPDDPVTVTPDIPPPEPEASQPAFKFQEELEDYVNKLTIAGIPATEAATRVQVQASLAELAQRVLEEMEKLDEMEKDCDAKIKSTFQEMKKVVKGTKKTVDESELRGSGDIGKTTSGGPSGKET